MVQWMRVQQPSMLLVVVAALSWTLGSAFLPQAPLHVPITRSSRGCHALKMAEPVEVLMPALSSTMTEGKIVQWAKKVGDKVKSGDTLMVVESDKADMDVESFEEGFLASILFKEGDSAPVGQAVALLAKTEADIKAVQAAGPKAGGATAAAPAPAPAPAAAAAPAAASASRPSFAFSEVFMPALSSTMTEGKIVQWTKKVGDKINSGDTVMVVESDKADMDVESFDGGFLAAVLTKEGEAAAVGAPVALLAANEADIPALQAYGASLKSGGGAAAPAAPAAAAASAPAPAPAPAAIVNDGRVVASGYAKKVAGEMGVDLRTIGGTGEGGRIRAEDVRSGTPGAVGGGYKLPPGTATPQAKMLAADAGLDLKTVQGTGNFGRITADDVLIKLGKKQPAAPPAPAAAAAPGKAKAAATGPAPKGVVPMDGMQKAVAKNMEKTLSVPVFRVSRAIVTDKFDELYKKVKAKGVSVSALLAKAVAMVLEKHPIMNAVYDPSGAIKYNDDINVAMAVALDGGLITPTIRKANTLDIYSVGRVWKELVTKAQEKRLTPDEYNSGTITISNLGMFGVSSFEAILPPNQGTILAIGSSLPTVVPQSNGYLGVVKKMTVTVTCDHRHIYGAQAAEFLADLADLLENNVDSLLL